MLKYLAILSLGLCACGGSINAPAPETAHNSLPPVVHFENTEAVASNEAFDVEISRGRHAQAIRCSDNLDCLTKMNGRCPNGYNSGDFMTDGTKVVGLLFHCITDEEKAALDKQAAEAEAETAAWEKVRIAREAAAREAELKAAQEETNKKQHPAPSKK